MADVLKVKAEWIQDCQGKWDYDGEIVSLSTRYWPRGGGFHVLTNVPDQPVTFEGNEARPDIKPSAHSAIHINFAGGDEYMEIISESFEGETEAEVKHAVEQWAQQKFAEIAALIIKWGAEHG